jgi:ribosome-associated heat shock protein Hsp15
MNPAPSTAESVRLDKWLWCARFFKTRALAQEAVEGGKVRVNDTRVKPSKEVRPGDTVMIHIGEYEWVVTVLALSRQRGPAEVARMLYEESEDSRRRRSEQVAEHRSRLSPTSTLRGRPTKKARRQIRRFTDQY